MHPSETRWWPLGVTLRIQTEIDVAAFHPYGLDQAETAFVLEDFHQVQDPRIMTDDYFDQVLENYDELAEKGPLS